MRKLPGVTLIGRPTAPHVGQNKSWRVCQEMLGGRVISARHFLQAENVCKGFYVLTQPRPDLFRAGVFFRPHHCGTKER